MKTTFRAVVRDMATNKVLSIFETNTKSCSRKLARASLMRMVSTETDGPIPLCVEFSEYQS